MGGDGADNVPYTTPIEPLEDAIESAGGFVQAPSETRDETVGWFREAGELYLFDQTVPAGAALATFGGGGGISEGQHTGLDTLVHALAEDSDTEVIRTSGRVTSVIVWTDSGHTVKIRETLITRSAGQVATITTKQYDGTGTLKNTLTKTITRASGQVASIDGALT